jgi:hypothetical protein
MEHMVEMKKQITMEHREKQRITGINRNAGKQ